MSFPRVDDAAEQPIRKSPIPHLNSARCEAALDDLKSNSKKPEICWDHSCRALPISKATFRPSPTRWFFSPPGLTMSNRPTVHFAPRWLQVTDPGPKTLCRWMRIGIQDGSEILTQVQMMIMHEAPLSCGFVANNATVACPHGLKRHSRQTTIRKEPIAKEEPNQLESYFLQDQIVHILWQYSRMAAYRIQSTALCIAKSTILVRQLRSPEWREIGRRFAPLWNFC